MMKQFWIFVIAILAVISVAVIAKEKPDWAKKDIRDYTDADMERLFEQWEENEEPLPDDELPEYLRKSPQLDMSQMDFSNPEMVLKAAKKGKTLMMFVTVDGPPNREQTETLTQLWQSSLQNNHIPVDRFIISDSRVIFMFKDGAQAWDAKDYLIKQKGVKEVSIENKIYPGEYSSSPPSASEHEEL